MTRYKSDATQAAIIKALRDVGCTVEQIESPVGKAGLPDLLVGRKGVTYLLEVKVRVGKRNPRAAVLSGAQADWHLGWRGRHVDIVTTPEEALAAVGVGT